jgi:glucosyl-dolichyl phosphate glucuronosyltransferase
MNVTVVVCTYNRCAELQDTLTSLVGSQVPDSVEWEILVVDNNSTDQTRAVVEKFAHAHPQRLRYAFEPVQGKSWALNRAVREALGDVVVFTDDDVRVDCAWLENLSAPLEDGRYAGSSGRTLPPGGFTLPRWLALNHPYALAPLALFDRGLLPRDLDEAPYGNNMAYRKEVFAKHGEFRTNLGPRPGENCPQKNEDSEFGNRLLRAGERLCYVPSAVVYHSVPPQRLQKAYFLSWYRDKARSDARTGTWSSSAELQIAGVPVSLLRRLARWTLQWLFSVEPSRRFSCKLKMWSLAGTIEEARQWHRERLHRE